MIKINLLPEEIRENIEYSKKNKRLLKYFRTLIVMCLLFLSAFVFFYVFLTRSNSYFLDEIKESESEIGEYQEVLSDAQELDGKIQVIEDIKADYKFWSKLNLVLDSTIPEGLYLESFGPVDKTNFSPSEKNVSSNDTSMKIETNGYAITKNSIGLFRDALASQDGISMVNVEKVTLADETKNRFVITLVIDKDVMEKGK